MNTTATADPILQFSPRELADVMIRDHEILDRQTGAWDRRASHRAAEVKAWDMQKAHGVDTAKGRLFGAAACEIAERYHNVLWQDEQRTYDSVPLFGNTGQGAGVR